MCSLSGHALLNFFSLPKATRNNLCSFFPSTTSNVSTDLILWKIDYYKINLQTSKSIGMSAFIVWLLFSPSTTTFPESFAEPLRSCHPFLFYATTTSSPYHPYSKSHPCLPSIRDAIRLYPNIFRLKICCLIHNAFNFFPPTPVTDWHLFSLPENNKDLRWEQYFNIHKLFLWNISVMAV